MTRTTMPGTREDAAINAAYARGMRAGMEAVAKWHDEQAGYHYDMAAQLIADGRPSTAQRASENAEAHQEHAAALRAMAEETRDA
jgi:hypothetical protein